VTSRHVTGVVLAGGLGRRFGAPKAGLLFKGEPLLDRTAVLLEGIANEVLIVGRPPLPLVTHRAPRTHAIVDRVPDAGPLVGLATALDYCHPGALIVVACDMPLLSASLLAHEARLLAEGGADAVVPVVHGVVQPLHAVYSTRLASIVERLLARGASSLRSLIDEARVRYLGRDEWGTFSPDGRSFTNVNTAAELRAAEAIV